MRLEKRGPAAVLTTAPAYSFGAVPTPPLTGALGAALQCTRRRRTLKAAPAAASCWQTHRLSPFPTLPHNEHRTATHPNNIRRRHRPRPRRLLHADRRQAPRRLQRRVDARQRARRHNQGAEYGNNLYTVCCSAITRLSKRPA